jgi:spermidine/putrescine transport system ATP-binding protein
MDTQVARDDLVADRERQPQMTTNQIAVSLHGVTKRFGEHITAVDDVDLEIRDGEFFSLLGPSGCGKTTTLRMIAGLEFPTDGSIRISGEEMALRPPNKRPVNTVFQSYALFPHMNVEENVGFGLLMRKVDKAEIEHKVGEAIELVRLEGMGAGESAEGPPPRRTARSPRSQASANDAA